MPSHGDWYSPRTSKEEAREARGDCPYCNSEMGDTDECPTCGEAAQVCFFCGELGSEGDHSQCGGMP